MALYRQPQHNRALLTRVIGPGRHVVYEEHLEHKYEQVKVFKGSNEEDLPLSVLDARKPQPFPYDRYKKFNLVTSLVDTEERLHMPTLDIDIPAVLIPSSTQDHFHLYFDVEMTEEQYFKLLDVLAEVGIVEEGYVEASKKRGFSSLRLPGAKKANPKDKTKKVKAVKY